MMIHCVGWVASMRAGRFLYFNNAGQQYILVKILTINWKKKKKKKKKKNLGRRFGTSKVHLSPPLPR